MAHTTLTPFIRLLGVSTEGALVTGDWFPWLSLDGRFTVCCANLNNAVVRLEVKGPDGVTGVPVDPSGVTTTTFTGSGAVALMGGFRLEPGAQVRAGINGTPSAPVFADVNAIPD